MSQLSTSEGRASKSEWTTTRNKNSFLEVGICQHGFVVGLPKTRKQYYSIWVIVDRMTKSSHFIPVKSTYQLKIMQESILKI